MTIKYELHIFFFELTDNDGQNFLAGIVHNNYFVLRNKLDSSMSNFCGTLSQKLNLF
jgi:hypothetical protein